jgi:hypothetical protein
VGLVIIFATMMFLITVGIFPKVFPPSSHATVLIFHLLRYLWPLVALFLGYVCYFILWTLLQKGPIVAFNSRSITLGFYPKRMEFEWSQIKAVREVSGKKGPLVMIEFEDPSVYEDQIGFLWLWMVARPNRKKHGGTVLISAEGLGVSQNDLKSSILDAFARKGTSAAPQQTNKPDRDWWLNDKTSA